jgi:hypothetical protein
MADVFRLYKRDMGDYTPAELEAMWTYVGSQMNG